VIPDGRCYGWKFVPSLHKKPYDYHYYIELFDNYEFLSSVFRLKNGSDEVVIYKVELNNEN